MSVSKLIIPPKKTADQFKTEMLAKIGDISGIHVYHNFVLGMVYIQEKYGSIIATDGYKLEDTYQGKIMLCLKTGPSAFLPQKGWVWEPSIGAGDWIVIRPSDGISRMINGQMCRLFRDENVTEKLDHPEIIR